MLTKISFENYKAFRKKQILELKPLTILIGKNSSGKSAITKLPTILETSLSGSFKEPLKLVHDDIELGGEFRDLVYGRMPAGLDFELYDELEQLNISIASGLRPNDRPKITSWKFKRKGHEPILKGLEDEFHGFLDTPSSIKSLSISTDYIGPFRVIPERSYYFQSSSFNTQKIGVNGKSAYHILIEDALTTEQTLLKKVNTWYKANFENWGIRVNKDKAPHYEIELVQERQNLFINIKDVGQGMSQILPLVIRAFMPQLEEKLLIIEQPELHLHPAAHGNVATLFATTLKENNNKYLIETHSQNFVLRLRRLVAEGTLNVEQLGIYYVDFDEEKGYSTLEKIKVLPSGAVENWPQNIFSETLDETVAIRTAQLNQEKDANRD